MLNKDFREFVESLNSNKVKYLIVGGLCDCISRSSAIHERFGCLARIKRRKRRKCDEGVKRFRLWQIWMFQKKIFCTKEWSVQLGYPPNQN